MEFKAPLNIDYDKENAQEILIKIMTAIEQTEDFNVLHSYDQELKAKNWNKRILLIKTSNMTRIIAIIFTLIIMVSCNSQKVYSDFDISYSKSGGYAPVYENLLIKGNNVHYSFEGGGKNIIRILPLPMKI